MSARSSRHRNRTCSRSAEAASLRRRRGLIAQSISARGRHASIRRSIGARTCRRGSPVTVPSSSKNTARPQLSGLKIACSWVPWANCASPAPPKASRRVAMNVATLDATTARKTPAADPIAKQIIRHQLIAVPNQIEKNIERTAFSPLVQEYKDYSVGFVDAEGRLVAQSRGSLPIFVANALGTAVREGLGLIGRDGMKAGDIIISNTAATLGQHLNNVPAYTPVRYEAALLCVFAGLVP